jgi:hypothetical protein
MQNSVSKVYVLTEEEKETYEKLLRDKNAAIVTFEKFETELIKKHLKISFLGLRTQQSCQVLNGVLILHKDTIT